MERKVLQPQRTPLLGAPADSMGSGFCVLVGLFGPLQPTFFRRCPGLDLCCWKFSCRNQDKDRNPPTY